MEIVILCIVAFFTSILTFFSGFGLGTVLTPVFAIFFPIDTAIAMTGVVHFSNNLFKITLIGRATDRTVLLRFGIPAVLASFAGAWLLLEIADLPSLLHYQLWGQGWEITPVKVLVAFLLIIFSMLEIVPAFQNLQFGRNKLFLGGVLSGFFGGLAGIQGAIRSAFLIKSGLSKEAYIATGVAIACLVDVTRISVYASRFVVHDLGDNLSVVISATVAALAGALAGRKLLKKVTLRVIQNLVAALLILVAIALGLGFI